MLEELYIYGSNHRVTPEEYESQYYSSRPWLVEDMKRKAEARRMEDLLDNLPDKKRGRLPVASDRFYLDKYTTSIDPRDFIKVPHDHQERVKKLLARNKLVQHMRYGKYDPAKNDPAELVTDVSASVVNDRNCYYTKYEYSCPKCGKKISFVDVLSIHFLEEVDKEETGNLSFLELDDVPVTTCSECNTPLVFSFGFSPLFYDIDLIKQTISYRLVQNLKLASSQVPDSAEKTQDWERPMPDGLEPSIKFVKSKIVLGKHGYSYFVNTYECCHCHRQYSVCDLNSLRKEPFFVPKNLRSKELEVNQIADSDDRFYACKDLILITLNLKQKDKERSSLPTEQWALPPYCLECGHFLYTYDLYEGEPIPTGIDLPYDNSLFI